MSVVPLLAWFSVVIASLTVTIPQHAAPRDSPKLTLGTVALLATHKEPAATTLLQRALLDRDPLTRRVAARVVASDHRELFTPLIGALAREQDPHAPSVRRVAGRVIAATSRRELIDPLKKALAVEQDPRVAAELVSDLLDVAGAAALPVAEAQVQRVGGPAVLSFAEWLARLQPEQLAAQLPELTKRAGDAAPQLANRVALAVAEHPAARDRLFRSWMAAAPEHAWNAFLDAACSTPEALSSAEGLLNEALRSDRPSVRAETVWFVVDTLAQKRQLSAAVIDAALPSDAQPADANGEALGRELIARREKKTAIVDRSAQISAFLTHHDVPDPKAFPRGRLAGARVPHLDDQFFPSFRRDRSSTSIAGRRAPRPGRVISIPETRTQCTFAELSPRPSSAPLRPASSSPPAAPHRPNRPRRRPRRHRPGARTRT